MNHLSIIDNVEWTDPFLYLESYIAANSKYWIRSDIVPEIGQQRLILVTGYSKPYNDLELSLDSSYNFLFQPGLSSINGYEENYKEEIDNFFIVNATIKQEIDRNSELWRLIEMDRVINLSEFQSLVKPQAAAPKIFDLKEYCRFRSKVHHCKYKNWFYTSFSQEYWWLDFIFWDTGNKLILVYAYENYLSTETALITNYKLSDEEHRILNLALYNPKSLLE